MYIRQINLDILLIALKAVIHQERVSFRPLMEEKI